jgi:fibronectin-binding autotransporter adhesin
MRRCSNRLQQGENSMGRITSRVPHRRHVVRRVSSCLALAATAALASSAQGTAYTWKGTANSNWDNTSNWSFTAPGTFPSTAGDTATFSGTVTANQPVLDVNESIAELIFSTSTGGWNIGGTSTFTLNGAVGINALGQTSQTSTISDNFLLAANQTWEVGTGGTLVISGTVEATNTSAPQSLTIAGGGTINLTGNSAISGTTGLSNIIVNSGMLDVSGAGIVNTGGLILNGGTTIADNSAQEQDYRFGFPGVPFTTALNGGTFVLKGNSANASNEYLGDTTIGSGRSTLTVTSVGGTPTLTLNSLNRAAGAGVLFVNGTGLGTAGSPDGVIFNGQIVVTNAPSGQVGGTQAGTADNAGVQNASILPYVLGEVPVSSNSTGSVTGTPDTFVAYTSGGTLRPLNPVDEYSHVVNPTVNGNNIYINSATTATTASINSLVINGADLAIGDSQAVNDTGGALLFVTSNGITPANTSGTFVFGNGIENIVNVNPGITGTISAAIGGSGPVTYEGLGQLNLTSGSSTYNGTFTVNAGTLQFGPGGSIPNTANVVVNGGLTRIVNGSNPNYVGTLTSNAGPIQFGNGTAGNDGSLANPASTINMGNTNNGSVAIDNVGATTFGGAINTPTTGVNGNIYVVGPGAVTFNGNIDMESGPGAPFMWLHGGAGGGAITINGNITQNPAVTQNPGTSYFYVATNGGVTFNANDASEGTTIYLEGIPTSVIYNGIATPTVGGKIPNIVVTLSSTGSVGNGFTNGMPNSASAANNLTISNINRAGTNVLPPAVTFNQNGPINASGGSAANVTTDGYYSGATIWNVNAPLAVAGPFRLTAGVHLNGANQPSYGILNVAPGQTVFDAPFLTNSQTGYFIVGYGNNNDASYGYLRTGAGATINADGNESTTYFGYNAHGLVDLTNLNNDGSSGSGSTFNTYFQTTANGGGSYAGQASVVNLYPGSTLNQFSYGSNPGAYAAQPALLPATGASAGSVVNASGVYTHPTLNISLDSSNGGALGDTAVLNVMGGIINNANQVDASHTYAAGINLYGTDANDNHATTVMPNGILNISNGGTVRTGLIHAETITFGTLTGDASTFVNFGGYNNAGTYLPGELDYNGSGSSPTFIHNGVAGTYVYSGGAVIGTSINNALFTGTSVTVTQGLMAAPGRGVASITFNSGATGIGSGYAANPIVVIKDSTGFDATGYAVVDTTAGDANFGKITSIVVSNPGFNLTAPTLTFIGGGGTAPAASTYTINLTPTTSSGFQASGGLTKLDAGTLTLVGTYNNQTETSTALNSLTGTGTAAAVGLGNIPAAGAGNAPAGFRNNTSTYAGPTVIEAGTLALSNNSTNNNLPYSSAIVVGDVAADNGAIFDVSGVTTTGGFQLGPNQILSGFGTVKGAGGITIGAATGSNFGGGTGSNGLPAIAADGSGSMIAPGISPTIGTAQGHAAGSNTPVTGKLTLTTAGGSPLVTTLGPSGGYFWKLNLDSGGVATASTPVTSGTPALATAAGANVTGANWDAAIMDTINVTSFSGSPFTVTAFGFHGGGSNAVNIGGSNTQSYAWVVARVNDGTLGSITPANLAAQFALNTANLPAPANGWGYMLSTQPDPTMGGASDLVVSYSPAPEPTELMLLAPAAGAMLLRRRRNAAKGKQAV